MALPVELNCKSSSPMVRGKLCSPNHNNVVNSGEASFVREL